MDLDGLVSPNFWERDDPVVLAPPHLRAEGEALREKLATSNWGAGAVVFASSGSTGHPKWILHTRASLLASARMVNRHLEVGGSDHWFLALPEFHVGGFGVVARAHLARGGLTRSKGKWDAKSFADAMAESEATLTSLVPTQVHDLVAEKISAPRRVRVVVVGGGELDASLGREARSLGWPVLQSYGMTEAGSQVATASLRSLESTFRNHPLPLLEDWEVRLAAKGVLELRSAALFSAYLHLVGGELSFDPLGEEGWFASNDVVALSGDGLTFKGRADRMVKVRGELVDLDALERSLHGKLGGGDAVCLIALAQARLGHLLVPVVTLEEKEAGRRAVDELNTTLPKYCRLERPEFVARLPRTALGKVDYATLTKLLSDSDTSRLPKLK
jgi:O-succinylbenzoic acid--CoA ligase